MTTRRLASQMRWRAIVLWFMLMMSYTAIPAAVALPRTTVPFNHEWFFFKGDDPDAGAMNFDETKCTMICVPHTNTLMPHANIDTSSFAFVSWYRKHYTPPKEFAGKRFLLEFEAVSKVAEVFMNGTRIGEHKGAYTPFSFDITDRLEFGADNVIAVRVDARQRTDVPPEGRNVDYLVCGGIVRDVFLTMVDPLHVERVYARRDTGALAKIVVETVLKNDDVRQRHCSVNTRLIDAGGAIAAQATHPVSLDARSCKTFHWTIGPVADPHPWHPDTPYLYTVTTMVSDSSRSVDSLQFRFGIRSFSFSNAGTLMVNGHPLKLLGLNRHETFPFIGRAAANRLQARDAEIIKYDFGCNIVRCSHYPQDPAFLDRCDEIGLLVLEEMAGWVWVTPDSSWQGIALKNLEEMILRDRNHASILSFGVRINQSADFHQFYTATNRLARTLDPSRPTHGARVFERGSKQEFLEDIWTENFAIPDTVPPVLPWIVTEIVGHWCSAHSWDNTAWLCGHAIVHAAALDSAAENPALAGILGWCAFDYNSAYHYAEHSVCYHGVADMFRQPKPAAFVYQSQRNPERYGPMIHILHDWSEETKPNDVWVASNCDSVELFVNGASQGRIAPNRYRSLSHPLFRWQAVPFRAGEIRVDGWSDGRVVATHRQMTPGKPVRLTVVAEDTLLEQGGDMTRVVVTAIDRKGQPVPRAAVPVAITVTGAADFLGASPILLENGRTSFFVKTRARKCGAVRCVVKGRSLKAGEARITVCSK